MIHSYSQHQVSRRYRTHACFQQNSSKTRVVPRTAGLIKVIAKSNPRPSRSPSGYVLNYPCASCRRFKLPFPVEQVQVVDRTDRGETKGLRSFSPWPMGDIAYHRLDSARRAVVRSFVVVQPTLYARLAIDCTMSPPTSYCSFFSARHKIICCACRSHCVHA